jgi:hypothetical protein
VNNRFPTLALAALGTHPPFKINRQPNSSPACAEFNNQFPISILAVFSG